jgi:peptidoglycan/LPS O-acetylase OafA/YrhL
MQLEDNTATGLALLKGVAAQLIVWHHLVIYGPLSETVRPHAEALFAWLARDARQVVQVFLVVAGYLAARSLVPRPGDSSRPLSAALLWRRYARLLGPYLPALLLALACAAAARALFAHADTPAPPTLPQLLAHLLLLQDLLGFDALSAGVWYLAIDLQLYGLLLVLLWSGRRLAAAAGLPPAPVVASLVVAVLLASLFWLNREPELDVWAPYFFGAYGLGILIQWLGTHELRWVRHGGLATLAGIVLLALLFDWRSRLAVAALTAAALYLLVRHPPDWHRGVRRAAAWLGRNSYALFLSHYPVCLLVGAVFARLWPGDPVAGIAGLGIAWAASLAAGEGLCRLTERR